MPECGALISVEEDVIRFRLDGPRGSEVHLLCVDCGEAVALGRWC